MPHPACAPSLAPSDFFVSLDEKRPQRETYGRYGRGETKKMAETLKGIKIEEFKNCFEEWKKCLDRYIASNGEYLKVN